MKITTLSSYDINRPLDWSGTPYYCVKALKQVATSLNVLCRSEHDVPPDAVTKYRRYAHLKQKYLWTRDLCLIGGILQAKYKQLKADSRPDWLLFFSASDAAYIETDIPSCIIVDATWKQYVLSYSPFLSQPICPETYEDGLHGEALGFSKAALLLCLTEWAAQGVVQEYPEMKHKVAVVHPGANLADTINGERISEVIANPRKPLNLLFIGLEAHRKGLDIAIGACEELRSAGIDACLDVVTSEIQFALPKFVRVSGYVNKHRENGQATFDNLYSKGFALLLPARAECAGIVICEAAAFGVPAIVSGVGGTRELVKDGWTGYVAGTDSGPVEYADRIKYLVTHPAEYVRLARNARIHYETRLNWNIFAREMIALMTTH